MEEPVWIDLEDCRSFHEHLLARFGGLSDLWDQGLLESALARPQQLFGYAKPKAARTINCRISRIEMIVPFPVPFVALDVDGGLGVEDQVGIAAV